MESDLKEAISDLLDYENSLDYENDEIIHVVTNYEILSIGRRRHTHGISLHLFDQQKFYHHVKYQIIDNNNYNGITLSQPSIIFGLV